LTDMRGNDFRSHSVRDGVVLTDRTVVHMIFCFESFAAAEEIYCQVFKLDKDIGDIIDDLTDGSVAGLQAIAYGAVRTARPEMAFRDFLERVYSKENELLLRWIVTENLNRVFTPRGEIAGQGRNDEEGIAGRARNDDAGGFPWDRYYRAALDLGLSDAEFWAATPRKIQYLSRSAEDVEKAAEAKMLTDKYV